ncbi:molybdopterin-binding protein [Arcobacter sp. s6]|uniref:molybdopterin-binding protein n=1 Tax=Arcobacter sp. s6 TaxID=3230363 RepID=UPI0034A07D91
MSKLLATIKKISTVDNLNIVEFDFHGEILKMMSLDLGKEVQVGKKVILSVKSTNVLLAKNLSGDLSFSNKLVARIENIENGILLSSIILKINDTYIESIITADSSIRMNLQENDIVTVLIKASNLSIEEILND